VHIRRGKFYASFGEVKAKLDRYLTAGFYDISFSTFNNVIETFEMQKKEGALGAVRAVQAVLFVDCFPPHSSSSQPRIIFSFWSRFRASLGSISIS
jgi:hypothetical protein